jgi:hypothetical protein
MQQARQRTNARKVLLASRCPDLQIRLSGMASLAEWFGGIRKQLDDLQESGFVTAADHQCPDVK